MPKNVWIKHKGNPVRIDLEHEKTPAGGAVTDVSSLQLACRCAHIRDQLRLPMESVQLRLLDGGDEIPVDEEIDEVIKRNCGQTAKDPLILDIVAEQTSYFRFKRSSNQSSSYNSNGPYVGRLYSGGLFTNWFSWLSKSSITQVEERTPVPLLQEPSRVSASSSKSHGLSFPAQQPLSSEISSPIPGHSSQITFTPISRAQPITPPDLIPDHGEPETMFSSRNIRLRSQKLHDDKNTV